MKSARVSVENKIKACLRARTLGGLLFVAFVACLWIVHYAVAQDLPNDNPVGGRAEDAMTFGGVDATPIAYGQTVTGTIGTAGQVVTYTFTADAGDVVLVGMSDGNYYFDPEVRLYGPGGSLINSSWSTGEHTEFTQALSLPGSYTILAGDYGGTDTAGYGLFLQRLNNPGSATALPFGQTATGTISKLAEMHTYTFTADAGDVILVGMSDGNYYFDPEVRLYGPDGSLLSANWSSGEHAELTQALSLPGSYTILAGDYGGTDTAGYGLFLQRLNNPGSVTALPFGQTATGTISKLAEMHTYTFTADGGDIVLVGMSDGNYYFDPEVRLYGPDGSLLSTNWSSGGRAEFTQTLSLPGSYTILAGDNGGTDFAGYGLFLQRLNNPGSATALPLGQTTTGAISLLAEMHTYTFAAEAGQSVLVRMSDGNYYFDPEVRLYGPDGSLLSANWSSGDAVEITQRLPITGTYAICAGDYGGTDTGNYTLSLQGGNTELVLPIGITQEITVSSGLPLWYRIDVPSGASNLFVTLQKYDSWGGQLVLYDADNVVASASGSSDQILQLPSPATQSYHLTVAGAGRARLTAYLALPELTLGQWRVGTILHSWGSAWYQYTVPAGQDSLFVNVETIGLWSELKVYRGTLGSTPFWHASGPTMDLEIPAPTPGIYYAHLSDSAWINGEDQRRDHLIRADVAPVAPPPCTEPLITSFTPAQGGTAGPVTIQITGQCLDPLSTVSLTRDGFDDVAASMVTDSEDGLTLSATFDFSATEPGEWTLWVTNPSSQSTVAATPFTVVSGGEAKLWVEILGRDQIRAGRWATYIVRYGNSGMADANFSYLALSAPAVLAIDVDLPWLMTEDAHPWPGNSAETTVLFATLVYLPSVPAGTQREFAVRFLPHATMDGLTINADITTKPSPYLPDIPDDPLSFLGIQGEAAFPVNATHPVSAPTLPYHTEPSCSTNPPPGYVLVWKDYGVFDQHVAKSIGGGEYIEMVPGGIKTGIVSGYVSENARCILGYQGALKPPWWSEADAARVQQAAQRIKELNRPNDDPQDMIKDVYNWNDPAAMDFGDFCGSEFSPLNLQTNTPAIIKTHCFGFVEFLNPQFETQGGSVGTPWDWLWNALLPNESKVNEGLVYEDSPCRKALFDKPDATKTLRSITSVSPEDKYGPAGWDAPGTSANALQRWIPSDRQLDYRIDFWNKENAPAATVDVIITDTLDADLDWATFEFTEIGFLDWRVQLEPTQYFNVDVENVRIDLSPYYTGGPVVTMTVNVEGTFDPTSGEIRWEFHALEPGTFDPPEEPLAGFLPPITDSGWEIGWVGFSVSPEAGLASGTVISNQSFVKFDLNPFNPAPPGGPFINTLDAAPPASAVQSPTGSQRCSGFWVGWTGQDDVGGSGLESFDVLVDDLDDADPAYVWQAGATTTSAFFAGLPGHRYGLYTRARDHAANLESAPEPVSYDVELTAGQYCSWLPMVIK
jgi:hypothetical protein